MKRKWIFLIAAVAAIILLVPIKRSVENEGTIVYDALLYDLYDRETPISVDGIGNGGYIGGYELYILGVKVLDLTYDYMALS